jgi:glycosyltransferase involved in cell wall biosynthesis
MNLHEKKQNELVLLSPLKLRNVKNGKMVLTRKFIDGVMKYVENWPGKVVVLAEETHGQAKNLDDIEITLSELSFQVQTVSWQDPNLTHYFKNARLVLCALDDWQQIPIPSRCVAAGVPAVCITEYTIKTRRQIICSETANPFLRLRRIWWTTRLEKKRRQAIGVASGIQCNGTPTYFDYQSLNDNRHLFFDSRVEEQLLATDSVLQERTRQLQQGSPLRLAFSGRLVAMKGAHHLPKVACELRRLGVSFTFDIYGDGVLASKIKSQVDALNLGKYVQLRGILNFSDELIPP